MRSATTEQSPHRPAELARDQRLHCVGQSYLERLGIVYLEQIRLTIETELYTREMGVQQFYDTIGGSSYASVRRHFLKLAEHGWIRWVRNATTGRGRPEGLYRSTELPVIDTETFGTLPLSIRDALTVQLLEEMAARLGDSLEHGTADARADVASFRTINDFDEQAWCKANEAVEQCFQELLQEQTDAKIRLENSTEKPLLMVVNLAAFEAPRTTGAGANLLPKPTLKSPPPPWPQRVGKVFTDRLDLAIVAELNDATMTPTELQATLGGTSSQGFLRRCKRLADLGWTVNVNTQTGGALHGANVYQFRAAAPDISEADVEGRIPVAVREGGSWKAFHPFRSASIKAIDAGTFNRRSDRHLTMSPLLVDEIGWKQVTDSLLKFEEALRQVEAALKVRRRTKASKSFPAAFLLSTFGAPQREVRIAK